MKIKQLKYTDEDKNWVQITFEDNSVGQSSLTDGIRRQYTDLVQEYLDAGGSIEPRYTEQELQEQARQKKIAAIEQEFNDAMSAIVKEYPQMERESWTKQEQEARAFVKDSTVSTPLINALAQARGVSPAYLADLIVKKADEYATVTGSIIGKRQRALAEL